MNSPNPYESAEFRAVCGEALRPGGLSLTAESLELSGFPAGGRILDIGCGLGASLSLLAEKGFAGIGLDSSEALLAEAGKRGEAVVNGDMHALPWSDGWFDGALCECVLSLSDNKPEVLSECSRVLKPGSRLIVSDVFACGPEPDRPPEPVGGHCLRGAVGLDQFVSMLSAAGFTVLHRRDHSRALRELAAQLVWKCGSAKILEKLWGGPAESKNQGGAVQAKRLAYYLLVAEKGGGL